VLFVGTINCASGGFANNWTGASGGNCFAIPKFGRNLYFEPNSPTGQFRFFVQTGYSAIASPAGAAFWGEGAHNVAAGPFPIPRTDEYMTIAIYAGAEPVKVKVYVSG
jgi:hypothetical protein